MVVVDHFKEMLIGSTLYTGGNYVAYLKMHMLYLKWAVYNI